MFTESERQILVNGDYVTIDNGRKPGTVEHQKFQYKLEYGVLYRRNTGTADGCFWTDWVELTVMLDEEVTA